MPTGTAAAAASSSENGNGTPQFLAEVAEHERADPPRTTSGPATPGPRTRSAPPGTGTGRSTPPNAISAHPVRGRAAGSWPTHPRPRTPGPAVASGRAGRPIDGFAPVTHHPPPAHPACAPERHPPPGMRHERDPVTQPLLRQPGEHGLQVDDLGLDHAERQPGRGRPPRTRRTGRSARRPRGGHHEQRVGGRVHLGDGCDQHPRQRGPAPVASTQFCAAIRFADRADQRCADVRSRPRPRVARPKP